MRRILNYLGFPKPFEQIIQAIENQSITKVKQKEKSNDERSHFARKGIVGDWKNNFNENAIQLIKKELGDMLIEMKYEKDHNW